MKQTYYDKWNKVLINNDDKRRKIMDDVVKLIKKKLPDDIIYICNHYYGIVEYHNHEVPAMAHRKDFKILGKKSLKPIYDEFTTNEFGYTNFLFCCKVFDMIAREIDALKFK